MPDRKSRLFFNFPGHTLFPRFIHVDKAARKVEGAFRGLFGPACDEQFVPGIENQRHRRGTGVEIIDEAAVTAFFCFFVVFFEAG